MKLHTLVMMVAATLVGCVSHTGQPEPVRSPRLGAGQFTLHSEVVYTPPQWPAALTADIYEPDGDGAFPAVVMIHGGSWRSGTRAEMSSMAQKVARCGYVVMNVSYRLAPRWTFPAQLQDVQQAVLFLRAHANQYQVQPERVAAWGYSAGAHLAALLGLTSPGDEHFLEAARVQAVVGGGTPVDLSYYPAFRQTTGFMGMPYRGNEARWAEASPLRLVSSDDPPTFLYHGSFDILVASRNSHNMYAALNRAGVPAELYIVRGLEHSLMFRLSPVVQGVNFLDHWLHHWSAAALAPAAAANDD